ncbi:putative mannosylphosphorylation protein [Mytilinidion resinicola]|uniref:Mannosylphosphorylation protein n=1 Tax=Mytilinidion resinicola TaxID=574789 RepID=A0A6A6Z402_9PEZI|nr:putative mannosylphosphorylation protein [Mytilinidion resinicola]KAF2815806.1 putative mannosylphosphorylation protein [Mytilinidion resinicola]
MVIRTPLLLSLLVTLAALVHAIPTLRRRDADIESLYGITALRRDHSGKRGDNKQKYFHESTFHPHYDGRFADKVLSYDDRRANLVVMMKTYLSAMHEIGTETWIMHGSLLGWWWNRKIMPWDSDVDVQVSEAGMDFLAAYHNMTIHHYQLPGEAKGRDYMLEINPHYVNGSTADKLNVIDARWIDTHTGLFIDITALRRDKEAEAKGMKGVMMCKDKHRYEEAQIFPLRDSFFEGIPVKIPYAYAELLEEEYGTKALTRVNFEKHHFDEEKMEWIPLK